MRVPRPFASTALLLLTAALFATGGAALRQGAGAGKQRRDDAAGFKAFTDRVQDYVKLHKTIEATLPPLKPKEALPEVITAHQQALARKIREARANAKAQDIFTPASQPAFQRAVRSVFQDSHVRATVAQGAPLTQVRLNINEVYPDGVPQTTVPPTLLQKLPRLPDEVEYRIVGHDLLLFDVKASLVVDMLRDILP